MKRLRLLFHLIALSLAVPFLGGPVAALAAEPATYLLASDNLNASVFARALEVAVAIVAFVILVGLLIAAVVKRAERISRVSDVREDTWSLSSPGRSPPV